MNTTAYRSCLKIEPEDELDNAFIEDTLGLVNDGDSITLVRMNSTKSTGFNNTSDSFCLQTKEKIRVARHKKY